MQRRLQECCLALACLLALVGQAPADQAPAAGPRDTGLTLGRVQLVLSRGEARALVFLVSDLSGWNAELAEAADRLAQAGDLVVGVDLPRWLGHLAPEEDCHYLISDVEELSKELQRELKFKTYLSPIIAGVGAGGTLAYAALAQAPAATIEGAVSLDPAPALATGAKLCPGAPASATVDGWSYGRKDELPGWWRLGLRGAAVNPFPFADAIEAGETVPLPAGQGLADALQALIQPAVEEVTAPDAGPLADLPLDELPAQGGPARYLAVILSGDGGWRDLDKEIGEALAAAGVGVVGLDSLRYFWQDRRPEVIAQDLARIIRHYGSSWQVKPVLLIGYSFGADVLPATVARLPDALRARVRQISLLALSPNADFEFHVTGWLGLESGASTPVLDDIPHLDLSRVQCFYGEEEDDSLCPNPALHGAEVIRTAGGHHFDGDYGELARRILDGAGRRP